jgi:hypothetical protein
MGFHVKCYYGRTLSTWGDSLGRKGRNEITTYKRKPDKHTVISNQTFFQKHTLLLKAISKFPLCCTTYLDPGTVVCIRHIIYNYWIKIRIRLNKYHFIDNHQSNQSSPRLILLPKDGWENPKSWRTENFTYLVWWIKYRFNSWSVLFTGSTKFLKHL